MKKTAKSIYDKELYKRNKAKRQKQGRKWRKENPEKVLEHRRNWRNKNYAKEMMQNAKRRAKQAGMGFNLTLEDIVIPAKCPVLGIPIVIGSGTMSNSPSIDRIDSNKGYIKGNVAIMSDRANRLKNNGTAEEHEAIAKWMREQK